MDLSASPFRVLQEINERRAEEWEQREARNEKRKKRRWEVAGQLIALRGMLHRLLQKRFGPLPEALVAQIDGTTNLHRLQEAVEQVLDLKSLDDLQL